MGSFKMESKQSTCLGVFNLTTASWIIAFFQFSFNLFYIIINIEQLNNNGHPTAHLYQPTPEIVGIVTYYLAAMVVGFLGLCAAFLLAIGALLLPSDPSHLLTWLVLTSLHPLLFFLHLITTVFQGSLEAVADCLLSYGLS